MIAPTRLRFEPLEDRSLPAAGPVPLLFVHGILGSWEPGSVLGLPTTDWVNTRGYDPEKLRLTPLPSITGANAYQPAFDQFAKPVSAGGAGYTAGVDLFEANYDWRLPVAPSDGAFDGRLRTVTAASITDGVLEYGVDYFGYWLKKVSDVYEQRYGAPPETVDVVAHSMGNLVTRSYLQSDAYGGQYTTGGRTRTGERLSCW